MLRINWLKLKPDKLKIIFMGQRKQLKGTASMTPACTAGGVSLLPVSKDRPGGEQFPQTFTLGATSLAKFKLV